MSNELSISTETRPGPGGAPQRPTLEGLEAKWARRWDEDGTHDFDPTVPRRRVFSIDTPPPTVSGELHIGHVFSYTHTDTIARYKRMQGYSVWYPMGWDDNGLPTERRVQNYYGVRCDPSLPYDPGFVPPAEGGLVKGQPTGRDQPAELRRTVRAPHGRGRACLRRSVAVPRAFGRLAHALHDDRGEGPPRLAEVVPAAVASWGGVRRRSTDAVGHRFSHRRGPGGTGGTRTAGDLSHSRLPSPVR